MLRSVNFYDKPSLSTIKVSNIITKDILAGDWILVFAKELIPYLLFLRSHILPEFPGPFSHFCGNARTISDHDILLSLTFQAFGLVPSLRLGQPPPFGPSPFHRKGVLLFYLLPWKEGDRVSGGG